MIDRWWLPESGREPTLEDLDAAARRAVLARVDVTKQRLDLYVDGFLAVWLAGSCGVLVAMADAGPPQRWSMVGFVGWILAPACAAGFRAQRLRRATRRAVLRQVRRDRLAQITNALAKR